MKALYHRWVGRKAREAIWRVVHFWHYRAEMRHWLWRKRMGWTLRKERRRGKKVVLAYISVEGHWPFVDSLLSAVEAKSRDVMLCLAVDEVESVPEEGLGGIAKWQIRPLREFDGMEGIDVFLTPEHNCEYAVDGPFRICIFHGLPVKGKTFQEKYMRDFDGVFLQGPLQERMLDEFAGKVPEVGGRLERWRVGYPKTDMLFHARSSREDLLREMGVDPARKTVLYAPAFDQGTSLPQYGEEIFRVLERLDCNVIVKLHPVSYDRRVVGVHSKGIYWPEVADRHAVPGKFVHAGNVDVGKCLLAADVLLTDVSSVALEFMLLDKPVVYLECPKFYAQFRHGGAYEKWGDDPVHDLRVNAGRDAGLQARDLKEMEACLARAIERPDEHHEERLRIAEQMLFNAGHATEAGSQCLLGILQARHGGNVRVKISRRSGGANEQDGH